MKAIIELTSWKASQARALRAAKRADAGRPASADYHLDFDSMASLFSDITPARMQVIETSKQLGALSVYALAKAMGRNYSNVHRDVRKLLELELLARDEDGKVYVPWKDVVLNVSLTGDSLAA
ncbi:MAG: hypothetical protein WAW10_08565 [Gallionella sp.]